MNSIKEHKYGVFEYDVDYDVYIENKNYNDGNAFKVDGYSIKFLDDVKKPLKLSGPKIKDMRTESGSVKVKYDGKHIGVTIKKLMLNSAFPNVESDYGVQNINGDKTDNRLENLEWISRSQQAKEKQIHMIDKINKNGGRIGKSVKIYENSNLIGEFRSIAKAADKIIELLNDRGSTPPRNDTICKRIRERINTENLYKTYKFTS